MSIAALRDLPMKVYRVWDTERLEYWSNFKGKSVWLKPGHAKNAWNVGAFNRGDTKFSEQTRFEVHEYACQGWDWIK